MRILRIKFLWMMYLYAFSITGYCVSVENGKLTCAKNECFISENRVQFGVVDINVINYQILRQADIQKLGMGIYYSDIVVSKGGTKLWGNREFLDPSGDESVGIHRVDIAPNAKAVVLTQVGNYQYKLIVVYPSGEVKVVLGGPGFTWEEGGRYVFSVIAQDSPAGFVVFDTRSKRVVFRTDKYIYKWKKQSEGIYRLQGGEWDTNDDAGNQDVCYSLNLRGETGDGELAKTECLDE